jgi:hypothetical protein
MGNNSSDINKNEEPPLTSKYRTQNRRRQIAIEIQVLARDNHKNVLGLKVHVHSVKMN